MTSEENDKTLSDVTEQEQQEHIERGPGHLLRKKREALGLSVQEAADALHITMHYVRSLESDAHDKLPGDVFIKGYLRAYASLLGLDSTVLINVYNEYTNQREDADMASPGRRRRRRNRNTPWIVFSGIAFVVMAIVLWYFSSDSDAATRTGASGTPRATPGTEQVSVAEPANQEEPASSPQVPMLVTPGQPVVVALGVKEPEQAQLPATVAEVAEEGSMELTYPSEQQEAISQASGTLPMALASSGALMASGLSAAESAEGLGTPDAVELESIGGESVAQQVGDDNEPGNIIRIDAGGEDVVQIRFSAESMVQVQDANEEQVYRDVRVAGDVLRINGTGPFNILLGEASHATLSYNGEEIDFSASIRIDNSARLTVGL
ncbi:MAG: DUF4115 domain-containing protein [Gammaproteobacteria bacterium]|nr:helix-turn-helix domain-containing protein [Pseudomonadales bacterium]